MLFCPTRKQLAVLEKAAGTSGHRLRFSEHNGQVNANIVKLSLWGIVRILLGNQIKCATCVSILLTSACLSFQVAGDFFYVQRQLTGLRTYFTNVTAE